VKTRLAAEVDALLDYRGGLEKYRRDLWDHQAVAHSFAWNIEQMLIRCRDAGVPVVLMTPVANLRDCPPFKFELPDELSQEQRNRIDWLWDLSQRQRDQPELAVSTLRELLSNDSDHAGAHYYLGQLLLQHQEWDVALEHLERAKDLDVCPLRATSLIQSAVRHLAKRYGDSVWHVDVDQLFRDQSPHGIVGRNWLVDHVHPSIEGHQEIASAIHRRLIDRGWGPAAKALRIGESSEAMSAALNQRYRRHLHELGEHYFQRGKQRMEGLMLWTQGRAKKVAPSLDNP
jgi:tetratricopeptide (TPR) repeat protein